MKKIITIFLAMILNHAFVFCQTRSTVTTSGGTPGNIPVFTSGTNIENTTTPIFENSNKIGIGTTSPSVLFNVTDTKNATYSSTAAPTASTEDDNYNNAQTDAQYSSLGFKVQSVTSGNTAIGYLTLVQPDHTAKASNFTLTLRNSAGNYNEIMRLQSDGKVGIGTTSPSYKLHVAGDINFTGALYANGSSGTSGQVLVSQGSSTPVWTTASTALNSVAWLLSGNSGTTPGTNFIGTSDDKDVVIKRNSTWAGLLGKTNTSWGVYALNSATTGESNTAVGINALLDNPDGDYNTAVGRQALENTTGNNNTAIGGVAGYTNESGNNNTFVGKGTDVTSNNLSDATAIGYNATTNASDKIWIGTSANVSSVGGNGYWQVFSDGRFKENIIEDVPGLSFIIKLRPVSFTVNTEKLDSFMGIKQRMDTCTDLIEKDRYYQRLNEVSLIKQTGFIAQEVETAANDIGYNFDGVHHPENINDNYSIGYAAFVVPLVVAIKEQQKMIDSLMQHQKTTDRLMTVLLNCCSTGTTHKELQNDTTVKIISQNINNIELSNNVILYQNAPNPFGDGTIIKYFVPDNTNAQIVFFDMFGNQLNIFKIDEKGMGQLNINATNLSSGLYSYSLIINGNVVDTKKMIKL